MTDEWQGAGAHPSSPSPADILPPEHTPPRTRAAVRAAADPDPGHPPAGDEQPHSRPRRRRWVAVVLTVLLLLALGGGAYLLVLSQRWEDRADALDGTARDLGAELAQTRAELEESASTLALVESQLDGAQDQIHELADAVAQTGDDREVQRQVANYQEEVSAAATAVADAMDQCIAAQEELIGVLEEAATTLSEQAAAPEPEPTETPSGDESPPPRMTLNQEMLDEYRGEVTEFCQAATDANDNLQSRLEDS